MTHKKRVLTKLKEIAEILHETPPVDITFDNLVADLREVIFKIEKNL